MIFYSIILNGSQPAPAAQTRCEVWIVGNSIENDSRRLFLSGAKDWIADMAALDDTLVISLAQIGNAYTKGKSSRVETARDSAGFRYTI